MTRSSHPAHRVNLPTLTCGRGVEAVPPRSCHRALTGNAPSMSTVLAAEDLAAAHDAAHDAAAHDPDNDTCVSSAFEGCICVHDQDVQHRLVAAALAAQLSSPATLTCAAGYFEPSDDEPLLLDP